MNFLLETALKLRSVWVCMPSIPQRYVMCGIGFMGAMLTCVVYHSEFSVEQVLDKEIPIARNCTAVEWKHSRWYDEPVGYTTESFTSVRISTNVDGDRRFPWSSVRKMLILWLPEMVSAVASGVVIDMWGPRYVWGAGATLCAVPAALDLNLSWTTDLPAVLFGIGMGPLHPSCSALVAYWAPEKERTIFTAFIESALFIGFLIGYNCFQWKPLFDLLTVFWVFAWVTLFYNRPCEHPRISPAELHYLETKVYGVPPFGLRDSCKLKIPWKKIVRSPPYLSLMSITVGLTWMQCILVYKMRLYFSKVLNISYIVSTGSDATTLSMIVGFSSLLIHGWVSDKLINRGITSLTTIRRCLLLLSSYSSAVALLWISFINNHPILVFLLVMMLVYLHGMCLAPLRANVVDLAPRYSGLLRGLLHASRLPTRISCYILMEVMIGDSTKDSNWPVFFRVSAAILIIFSFPYLFYGSGDIQPWNYHGVARNTLRRRTMVPSKPQT